MVFLQHTARATTDAGGAPWSASPSTSTASICTSACATSNGRKYLWLDLQALAESLLRAGQSLEQMRYFTARVRNDVAGGQRQSDYLDALNVHSPLVEIKDGRFQEKDRRCRVPRRNLVFGGDQVY